MATARAPEALRDDVQAELVRVTAEVLGVDPAAVDVETDLVEQGFDRVAFHALAGRLGERFRPQLPPTVFRETATLRRLADRIVGEHQAAPTRPTHHEEAAATTT
jgi:hypothetical protein